jgi:3-isopropylmalate/(R)-2-methylmalate dehydratase small subunit
MDRFGGTVLLLDRDNINTDEIIPAKYLTEIEKEALAPHLLEDLELPGFTPGGPEVDAASVVLTRANFGCGSSREHAPWALQVNGIHAIIAESFARIFRQNCLNSGMLPVELPTAEIEALADMAKSGPSQVSFDLAAGSLALKSPAGERNCSFELSPFAMELIQAGGWVEYAEAKY